MRWPYWLVKSGAVALRLEQRNRPQLQINLNANNSGSPFIGPYRGGIYIEHAFIDYHKTLFATQTALPDTEELIFASLNHRVQVAPSLELDALFSTTASTPGHTLKVNEIESDSLLWSLGLTWSPILQRGEGLILSADIDVLESDTDTFGVPLTRDRVRALRIGANYHLSDRLQSSHFISATLSRGLRILGANKEGDLNISRSDAKPDFTKLKLYYHRQDYLGHKLALSSRLSGQWASGPLFSSEEFGYGGSDFGRAYHFSEIVGDHGLAAAVELNYMGFKPIRQQNVIPFISTI